MTALKRFQDALAQSEADCAIISSEENQRYLSGFRYTDGYLLITHTHAFLLADFRYIEAAQEEADPAFTVLRPKGTMEEALKELTLEHGLCRPAIEESTLSCASLQTLKDALPHCTVQAGASDILLRLRTVKTEEELAIIARAQSITDRAFAHILNMITPRMTERDVALELEFFMRKNGSEGVAFDTIAVSGSASSLPHGVPSDVPLRQGFLTMDFGAKVDGYCSDMTRTVVIGKADEAIKKVYYTVLSAQQAALDAIHEGIACREADEAARSIIRAAGYGDCFGHGLGHGVGLYIHEAPRLSPKVSLDVCLERGNVVTVEPGIYICGKYGCRIEDMIAIDPDGKVRNFTKSPKNLMEI